MDRWKEHFEELLDVKCGRQAEDDEEKYINERKEKIRDEGIRIEEVIEAIPMLKEEKQ